MSTVVVDEHKPFYLSVLKQLFVMITFEMYVEHGKEYIVGLDYWIPYFYLKIILQVFFHIDI